MKAVIRNIIFDFGGVIVDLNRKGTEQRFAEMGIDVRRFLGMSRQSGIFGDLELGLVTADEWCDRMMELAPQFRLEESALPLTRETPLLLTKEGCIEAWNMMVKGIPLRRLQALDALRRRYHVSLLSNTNELHVQHSFEHHFRAQGYEPTSLFEHLFLSNEMHMCKPDRGIYEEVLRRSGYRAEETLFIDDSEVNCKAFAELGVQTFAPRYADEWLGVLCPSVASIGYFDGVHLGHRYLIHQVKEEARRRGMDPLLVTFEEHPRSVLHSDYVPELLTSPKEKLALLHETGIDRIEMLHFTRELSLLSAREYMQRVLHDQLGVRVLVMGYDHRFGHDGGSFEQYQAWGEACGIEVVKEDAFRENMQTEGEESISSTTIRRLLQEGRVGDAARLLGHPYVLQGRVVTGHQVGHELGFPTANLQPSRHKLIPARGVYAVWVEIEEGETATRLEGQQRGTGKRYRGMLNIGERPTIDDLPVVTIEVNILDFDSDLYGRDVTVSFAAYLRPEQRFDSREELIEQIEKDRARVKDMLKE